VYARRVNGQTLTFGVSGMLWNRSLVMYDPETDSLWSHILGEAMHGPLKGKQLEQVPSVMTDWQTWRNGHPESTVVTLSRTSREYRREFYRQPERFVLGLIDAGNAKAWGFDRLRRNPVVNDLVGDRPVVIAYDEASVTARMYDRGLGQRRLTFRNQDGKMVDSETGSTWNPLTGQAVTGPMAGKHLQALPAIVSYKKTWYQFHPESEAY